MRDLPYIMMCAYRGYWETTGIIAYDKLTLDYSNCDRPGGGCAAMDIASGTFTAQTGGLYTVTFSGQADLVAGSIVTIYLLHNGVQLEESVSMSECGAETEHIEEMFSRTLVSNYSGLLYMCTFFLLNFFFLRLFLWMWAILWS